MTREEEIKLAASCHIAASNDDFKEYYEGFIAGAKWADKTMIDKFCKWLKAELYQHKDRDGYPNVESRSYTSVRDLIDNFKKAMELCI